MILRWLAFFAVGLNVFLFAISLEPFMRFFLLALLCAQAFLAVWVFQALKQTDEHRRIYVTR